MINAASLVKDLRAQLVIVQTDLRDSADNPSHEWGINLRARYDEAIRVERTADAWPQWRDNHVEQAAVAWIVATTFLRFCEDNDLLAGAKSDGLPIPVGWISGPGDRIARVEENLTEYFRANPTHNRRHWLLSGFSVLAAQPAGRSLVDPEHNLVWASPIGPETATGLIAFWRRTHQDGSLVHDFTDPELGTRFLGDLYQDLSTHAKKTYALLQTPEFIEEFILEQTLTPAIEEFGLEGLKLIDPSCGSGHFLLGAFDRLNKAWSEVAPGLNAAERVRRVMGSINGVDINPFAIAIARFRLTLAGLHALGQKSLVGIAAPGFRLAIGDSLLRQGYSTPLLGAPGYEPAGHDAEDLDEYLGLLNDGQYHVVVGNPPYITPKDKTLNARYRQAYKSASGKYALSVPFMELLFNLAIRGDRGQGSGYVGQITANSFMKRVFGKKLVEHLFAGLAATNPVDLTMVIDTSGAYIPGHGTPTVIVIGRRRRPVDEKVRAVLGVRGEPSEPADPARGLVWTEIVDHVHDPGYVGRYVTVTDLDRSVLSKHPWSLSGGAAPEVFDFIDSSTSRLSQKLRDNIGPASFPGVDDPFFLDASWFIRNPDSAPYGKKLILGETVRDWDLQSLPTALAPYDNDNQPLELDDSSWSRHLWIYRQTLRNMTGFGGRTREQQGEKWWTWYRWIPGRYATPLTITFAFVATHNHFVLDRGGKVFNRSAPVIKLPEGATEDQHLELLGVLNSSTACFWLKQVSHDKGNGGIGGGISDEDWEKRSEFAATNLKKFPLPNEFPLERARTLDQLANQFSAVQPAQVVSAWRQDPSADLQDALRDAHAESLRLRARMIFEQEELDWDVYRIYGLLDGDFTSTSSLDSLTLGQRSFEISLSRAVTNSTESTVWFSRHKSTPISEIPADWPAEYQKVVKRRLALIESDPTIQLLEKPEFKRRWAIPTDWETLRSNALQDALLDVLEDQELWRNAAGSPTTRSIFELADAIRHTPVVKELARALAHGAEPDLVDVISEMVDSQAVPFLAAYRYKTTGLEKFRTWQLIWELQRQQDAGEQVSIPRPPKFEPEDFARQTYWTARGKLDVPKERFIAYPKFEREGDHTKVYGWSGWSHRDQALALAQEIQQQRTISGSDDSVIPLVAGLIELEPWLAQWHSDVEPEFGASAHAVIRGSIGQYLAQLGTTRNEVAKWAPAPKKRARK